MRYIVVNCLAHGPCSRLCLALLDEDYTRLLLIGWITWWGNVFRMIQITIWLQLNSDGIKKSRNCKCEGNHKRVNGEWEMLKTWKLQLGHSGSNGREKTGSFLLIFAIFFKKICLFRVLKSLVPHNLTQFWYVTHFASGCSRLVQFRINSQIMPFWSDTSDLLVIHTQKWFNLQLESPTMRLVMYSTIRIATHTIFTTMGLLVV